MRKSILDILLISMMGTMIIVACDDDDNMVDKEEKEKEKMVKAQRSLIKWRIRKSNRKLMLM